MRFRSVAAAGVAFLAGAMVACAQNPVMFADSAEVYCTDAWNGVASNGVSHQRAMRVLPPQGIQFCRLDMTPLAGPLGNAAAGWAHDGQTGRTQVWCKAQGQGETAQVRMRFELYAIAGEPDARCQTVRAGQLP